MMSASTISPPAARLWTLAGPAIALAALLPLLAVAWFAFAPHGLDTAQTEIPWPHLLSTILPGMIGRSLALAALTCAATLILGSLAAWLVTFHQFPGRAFFVWALVLPFAIPVYILAYIYAELLDYAGPVQSALRAFAGWQSPRDYPFPPIRSLGGAVLVMTLAFYPYVYLAARLVFARQSLRILQTGRLLGQTAAACFFKTALPLARPALAAALLLVAIECLNDIGAVEHFGLRTLTAGLYDLWLGRGLFSAGAQIALVLLLVVFALAAGEYAARRSRRYHLAPRPAAPALRPLAPARAAAAAAFCAAVFLLAFLLPAASLIRMSWGQFRPAFEQGLLMHSLRSLALAAAAALATGLAAFLLAHAVRIGQTPRPLARLAALGYAVPGAVLALGVFAVFPAGQSLAAGLMALTFAYFVRFLALPYGAAEAAFARLNPDIDRAARLLGANGSTLLAKIHAPLLWPPIAAGALLAFVETMRELPASLILRPFGFTTLPIHIYERAQLGLLEESAPAALLLAALGLIPALLLRQTLAGWAAPPGEPKT